MPFPSWLPLLLGVLSAVGPLSTDMYLPAFPAIEHALGGAPGTAQVTLASWFVGLAFGQMTQGTLSDRYGRRGPLVFGLALFTVGSVCCVLAPNLTVLAAARLVCGFGGSAGMVITRAVVRDLTEGLAAARLMSRLTLVMGVAPILAPTLGGAILGFAGWQAIFWVLVVYGGLCTVAVALLLPETLPETKRVKLGLGAIVSRYVHVLGERGFVTHSFMTGFSSFGMFAYLGGSPDVFIGLFHLTPGFYGGLFGCCALGFIGASQVNPTALRRFGADRVMRWSARAQLAVTGFMLVMAAIGPERFGALGFLAISIPVFLAMATNGLLQPNAVVGALARHAAHAGAASALMGTLQFTLAAVSGLTVGLLSNGTAIPMAGLMALGALAAVVFDLCRPKRQ